MTSSPKAQAWFAEARTDLNAGNALLTVSDEYVKKSAFFAQQCVEKALKGFLTHHKKRPQKTHDMRFLARQAVALDSNLEELLARAPQLTIYVVATRYPDAASDDVDMLTAAKTKELLAYARLALEGLRTRCAE